MRITPLDIQQKKFKKAVRGSDAREVQDYLELIANELETFMREHNQLKDEFQKLQNQLFDLQEREKILKDTLITAQKMSVEIKNVAQKESEVIIGQAEVQGEKIINMAYQRLSKIIDEINEQKRQRARIESELKAILESHTRLLEANMSNRENEKTLEETVRVMKKS